MHVPFLYNLSTSVNFPCMVLFLFPCYCDYRSEAEFESNIKRHCVPSQHSLVMHAV